MSNPQHYKRRQIIVDRVAQTRTMLKICVIPILALFGLTAVVAVALVGVSREADAVGNSLPSMPLLIGAVALLVFGAALLLVLQAIRYSHRVAGPAYRIKQSLAEIQSGKQVRINLRPGDELHDVAEALNEFLESVEKSPVASAEPELAATAD